MDWEVEGVELIMVQVLVIPDIFLPLEEQPEEVESLCGRWLIIILKLLFLVVGSLIPRIQVLQDLQFIQ
ncbi:MAG: hypothetical protein EBV10_01425 [Synechococcaceae bacterium WB6_1A_059]|nr:hypothetical protein [Synechococcaceae bacterium WB6_1A_059]